MHTMKYVVSGTWEHPAQINKDGDVVVRWKEQEVLDVTETSIWCDECGIPIRSQQEYLDHRLSEDWQTV